MTSTQVNYLNIGLMIVSAVFAFMFPFQLFLVVYAVLGPAHYLTEISWLHDRRYFTRARYDHLLLIAAAMCVTLFSFNLVPSIPKGTSDIVTFTAFAASLVFVLVQNTAKRIVFIMAAGLAGALLVRASLFRAIFGVFLPTLIHVFVFTGLFILIGAVKGRSVSGILSLVVFLATALSFFVIQPDHQTYAVSDYVRDVYGYVRPDGTITESFIRLNYHIMSGFNLHNFGQPSGSVADFVKGVNAFFYGDPLALAVMSFIAFAYTYHYLNWFSKTSIIHWHNISRYRFAGVIGIWLVSLALYGYDYSVGLKWLFFLSITHVLLEFPLNHTTFIELGRELGAGMWGRKAVIGEGGRKVSS